MVVLDQGELLSSGSAHFLSKPEKDEKKMTSLVWLVPYRTSTIINKNLINFLRSYHGERN